MKSEELKKKIVGIIRYCYVNEKDYGYIFDLHIEKKINAIADALIAAGIGDVSELKKHRVVVEKSIIPEGDNADNAYVLPNILPTVKQLYSGEEVEKIVKEREEYKHRAEVAERALKNALNNDTCYFCNEKIPCRCEHRDWGSDECIKSLLQQAEKEFEEEGKDE